ncbi:MAG: hypothetical protein AAGC73_07390, partial [Verrucomicrobiota bacterium]
EWLARARKALDFIWEEMTSQENGYIRLNSVYYESVGASIEGFLHDYALLADATVRLAGKVALLDPSLPALYLERAQICLNSALHRFEDPHARGYFFTAEGAEAPVARRKEWFDNATPSGNSVLLHALNAIYALTGETRYAEALSAMFPAYSDYAQKVASGVAHALEAIAQNQSGAAVIKFGEGASIEALREILSARAWRQTFIVPDEATAAEGYQLCLGTTCFPPETSAEALFS